ncbi:FAD-binding 8 [Penicillium expansum]|nr:FAD-binding 8 [Penicillium expansum]
MGVTAALSIIITCLFASSGIRNSVYELFLVIHQGFACLILAALWYHLIVDGPDYVVFIWPCVAIWSFDRLGRISRLLIWNKVTAYSSAEYNSDANVIQIKARVRQTLSPSPGTYFYVYGWRSIKFWESHPFTLSSWNKVTTGDESYTELIFLVSIRGGFTSRLQKQLLYHGDSDMGASSAVRKMTLSVEGPYGPSFCPWKSEMAVFIIGGAGITVATSFMQQLLHSLTSQTDQKSDIRTIKIVWAVKNIELYRFVRERYISTWEHVFASNDVELSLDIYLTCSSKMNSETSISTEHVPQSLDLSGDTKGGVLPSPSTESEISTPSALREVGSEKPGPGPFLTTFYHGRPDISNIVTNQVEVLESAGGKRLALVGCGPKAMAHDIRLSFVDISKIPQVNVDFHLAPFGW